jgi:hypothetical protein
MYDAGGQHPVPWKVLEASVLARPRKTMMPAEIRARAAGRLGAAPQPG